MRRSIRKNSRAIQTDATNRPSNMTNANPGIFAPKNTYDQSPFSTNCTPNKIYARILLTFLRVFTNTKYNAQPNRKYSIVHATLNTHPGGVKPVVTNPLYHTFDSPCGVNKNPNTPGAKDITIAIINHIHFFIIYSFDKCKQIIPHPPRPAYRNECVLIGRSVPAPCLRPVLEISKTGCVRIRFKFLARPAGLEPAIHRLEICCIIHCATGARTHIITHFFQKTRGAIILQSDKTVI